MCAQLYGGKAAEKTSASKGYGFIGLRTNSNSEGYGQRMGLQRRPKKRCFERARLQPCHKCRKIRDGFSRRGMFCSRFARCLRFPASCEVGGDEGPGKVLGYALWPVWACAEFCS